MSTSEIAAGVHRLGTSWVNWYLVIAEGKVTVVDTGMSGYYDQLEPALRTAGVGPDDVEAIVITHHHTDHTGCAERIRSATGARVLAPDAELAVIRGEAKAPHPEGLMSNLWRPVLLRFLVHAIRNGGASFDPVGELEGYSDGATLDVPGRPRAIATPGHSFGHCALSFGDHGVLFAGDAMASVGWVSGSSVPQRHPFNEDRNRATESLAALEGEAADVVTFGHGEPFRGSPPEAVARARELLG